MALHNLPPTARHTSNDSATTLALKRAIFSPGNGGGTHSFATDAQSKEPLVCNWRRRIPLYRSRPFGVVLASCEITAIKINSSSRLINANGYSGANMKWEIFEFVVGAIVILHRHGATCNFSDPNWSSVPYTIPIGIAQRSGIAQSTELLHPRCTMIRLNNCHQSFHM